MAVVFDQPLVSVVVPCYNQGQYLEETISSVLKQTYTNWECIVVNDGSTDATDQIARAVVKKDHRLRYVSQPNKGVSAARNYAISQSAGTYILPLDADDLISPDYLEKCVKVLNDDPEVKIVYALAEKFGNDSGIWDSRDFDMEVMKYENLIYVSAMYRRKDWELVSGYSETLKVIEDWEFWINILKRGGRVVKLPVVGLYYRIHAQSRTRTYDWRLSEAFDFVYRKHFDFFLAQLGNPILLYKENKNQLAFITKINRQILYRVFKGLKKQLTRFKGPKKR